MRQPFSNALVSGDNIGVATNRRRVINIMPMELYSSEAFVRDIVNAISSSEGKPLNIGGNYHKDIDRAYVFQLISEAKKAVDGQRGTNQFDGVAAFQKKKVATAKKKRVIRKARAA
jgi:hypothetical protein